MTNEVDNSFLDWERSRKRLAAVELALQLATVQRGQDDAAPGVAAMGAEAKVLKEATQQLFEIALAVHRKQPKGKSSRKTQLARARRLA